MSSFDEQLNKLGPGKLLSTLPIDTMIAMLGTGVARAQEALDKRGVESARMLADATVDLPSPDDPSTIVSRSLLSLGFLPTFYQFSEATLELKIEMHYKVEENLDVHGEGKVDAPALGPVAIAASANATMGKKFNMNADLMTHVHLKLVSVPAPTAFLDFLRNSLASS